MQASALLLIALMAGPNPVIEPPVQITDCCGGSPKISGNPCIPSAIYAGGIAIRKPFVVLIEVVDLTVGTSGQCMAQVETVTSKFLEPAPSGLVLTTPPVFIANKSGVIGTARTTVLLFGGTPNGKYTVRSTVTIAGIAVQTDFQIDINR